MTGLDFYFDESEEQKSGLFTLAGFVADPAVWDQFTPKWQGMLNAAPRPVSEFHMADIVAQQGEFQDWTRPECDGLIIAACDVLEDVGNSLHMMGCSLSIHGMGWEKDDAPPTWNYVSCYMGVMMQAVRKFHAPPYRPWNFAFDDKEDVRQHVNDHFHSAKRRTQTELAALDGLFGGVVFADSKGLLPLQAADFIAWERRKHTRERLMKTGRPKRKSFERLCKIAHEFWIHESEEPRV